MKFYFAGAFTDRKELEDANAKQWLVSYLEVRSKKADKLQYIPEGYDVFLDSGAFSAWSLGKEIRVDDYIAFIKQKKDKFTVYANLDVIGDPEATFKQQEYIESKGVKALPVVHYGADLKYLHEYAKTHDYIALGGLVPYSKQPDLMKKWLDKCFRELTPYIKKGLKTHGFGVGAPEILKRYPFYSADSSGWLVGGQYGRLINWNPQTFKMQSGLHYHEKKLYTEHGANLDVQNSYHERLGHNIKEYLAMEKDITRLWEDRGIKWS